MISRGSADTPPCTSSGATASDEVLPEVAQVLAEVEPVTVAAHLQPAVGQGQRLDAPQRLLELTAYRRVAARRLQAQQAGNGAETVGDAVAELAQQQVLVGKGAFQVRGHRVERRTQPAELVRAGQAGARRQVAGAPTAGGGQELQDGLADQGLATEMDQQERGCDPGADQQGAEQGPGIQGCECGRAAPAGGDIEPAGTDAGRDEPDHADGAVIGVAHDGAGCGGIPRDLPDRRRHRLADESVVVGKANQDDAVGIGHRERLVAAPIGPVQNLGQPVQPKGEDDHARGRAGECRETGR